MITAPGSFQSDETRDAWKIYAHLAEPFCRGRALKCKHPFLNVTEHVAEKNKRIYALVNASPEKIETDLEIAKGWKLDKKYPVGLSLGNIVNGGAKISIDASSGAVLVLRK